MRHGRWRWSWMSAGYRQWFGHDRTAAQPPLALLYGITA